MGNTKSDNAKATGASSSGTTQAGGGSSQPAATSNLGVRRRSLLALSNNTFVTCSDNSNTLEQWSLQNGKHVKSITAPHAGAVSSLVELDNQSFSSCSLDGSLCFWSSETLECIRNNNGNSSGQKRILVSLAKLIKNKESILLIGSSRGTVTVVTSTEQTCTEKSASVAGSKIAIVAVEALSTGHVVFVTSDDHFGLWTPVAHSDGSKSIQSILSSTSGNTIGFAPMSLKRGVTEVDRETIAIFTEERIGLWRIAETLSTQASTDSLIPRSDPNHVNFNTKLRCSLIRELIGHTKEVTRVVAVANQLGPDSKTTILFSSSCDHTIRKWDPLNGNCLSLVDLGREVTAMTKTPDDSTIIATIGWTGRKFVAFVVSGK